MKGLIGEMRCAGYIGRIIECEWMYIMSAHNATISLGEKISLIPWSVRPNVNFSDIEMFMLRMHGCILAHIFDGFSQFGERVLHTMH